MAALTARVDALTVVARDLETSIRDLAQAVDDVRRGLAASRAELEASRAAHAQLRDEYRSLIRARDRLAKQYRGLAARHPHPAGAPPTIEAMSAAEAYDAFVDFVDFCKHVGVRPPDALPDYMP